MTFKELIQHRLEELYLEKEKTEKRIDSGQNLDNHLSGINDQIKDNERLLGKKS